MLAVTTGTRTTPTATSTLLCGEITQIFFGANQEKAKGYKGNRGLANCNISSSLLRKVKDLLLNHYLQNTFSPMMFALIGMKRQ